MAGFSIQAAIWGSLIGFSVLLAALAYLRTMPDAPPGSGHWTLGLALYVLRLVFYLMSGTFNPAFITFTAETLQAASGFLFVAGTLAFGGRHISAALLVNCIGAAALWAAFTSFVVNDFLLRSIPLYFAIGGALIYAGGAMLRAFRREKNQAAGLVGVALILWGLHKFDFPWLRPVEWFAPYGFLLAELFAMMATVGLLLITAGRLHTLAREAKQKHEQSQEHIATLNQLLQISLDNRTLKQQLEDTLDVVIAAPWLLVEPRGGIFLSEQGRLRLTVQRNLAGSLLTSSAQVRFGQCLCGQAAQTQEVVHAARVEERHETRNDGMCPHGHYSVPIVSNGETLGVLLLYLPDGRARNDTEVKHLRAVVDVIAGMIVRKRAEADLEESRERLVEAQRIARIGSWENDLQSGDSIWSDELYRILGYQPGEVAPSFEAFFERVHGEDREAVRYAVEMVDRRDGMEVEHRVVHPNGSVLYVSQLAEVVRDDAGRPVRLFGTTQDISEDKVAELALMKAKQGAEAANQAKSSFLATMSHELRTPLNAVIGFAQLLERLPADAASPRKSREYIGHIRESGEHLLSVINDILDISRIEAGQAGLEEVSIDMPALVRRTAALMEAKVRDGGLQLHLDLAPDLSPLYADARAVKQILLNLVANAVKFTEPGGRVTVSLALQQGRLELAVTDTGIGIAAKDHTRIFEPFVQAESELNRRFEGTGLGLPLVKSLSEQHGATITLKSALGEGTRVSVLFPAERLLPGAPATLAGLGA
jgi:PAS domain S-box-containing protein